MPQSWASSPGAVEESASQAIHVDYVTDPHGEPIPKADGTVATTADRRLVDCAAGEKFHVARVTDQSPEFLRFLSQAGLEIGTSGALVANEPLADKVTVSIGGANRSLTREMAGKLMVH